MDYFKIAAAIILFLIVVILIAKALKASKQKQAQKAKMEEVKRQQEEARRKIAEENLRKKKIEDEGNLKAQAHENEIQAALEKYSDAKKYRLATTPNESNGELLNITQFTPISKKRFIAFDLETTGLSNGDDAIIEIGAVLVEGGQITASYQQLVDPACPIPAAASNVNHITDDMVKGQPKIHEVLPAFLSFVGDDVLVAHNVGFDAGFIQQACMRNRFQSPQRYFDTMSLARYWPEAENKKLGTLIKAAGIENDSAHRALGDAKAVAELVLATNKRRKEKK